MLLKFHTSPGIGKYQDSLPEWSKGGDSSSTSASCVGPNSTTVSCWLLVHHLNHSVAVSWLHDGRTCTRVGGWWEADRRWPRDFGLHGLRGWCFEHPAPRGPAAVRSFDALGMLPATGLRSTKSSASRDAVGAIRVLEVFSSSRSVFHLMPRGTSNRRARKHLVAGSPCSAPVKGHSISGHAWFIWTPRRPAT